MTLHDLFHKHIILKVLQYQNSRTAYRVSLELANMHCLQLHTTIRNTKTINPEFIDGESGYSLQSITFLSALGNIIDFRHYSLILYENFKLFGYKHSSGNGNVSGGCTFICYDFLSMSNFLNQRILKNNIEVCQFSKVLFLGESITYN